ncbi:MAG: hypothetical protein ACYC0N_00355 [Carboxydocellales bacterium]
MDHVRAATGQLLAEAGYLLAEHGETEVKLDPLVLTVSDELVDLVRAIFGRGVEFFENAKELQAARGKGLPADYVPILAPHLLAKTMEQLDAVGYAVEEAGSKKEAIYANKPDLVQRKRHLEGQIKALEAEAVMQIQYEGKDGFVTMEGKTHKVSNDTARDAYRRTYTKVQREELAQVEGAIYRIEAQLLPANDNWQKAVESSTIVKAKAGLQGSLLNFLAARG